MFLLMNTVKVKKIFPLEMEFFHLVFFLFFEIKKLKRLKKKK